MKYVYMSVALILFILFNSLISLAQDFNRCYEDISRELKTFYIDRYNLDSSMIVEKDITPESYEFYKYKSCKNDNCVIVEIYTEIGFETYITVSENIESKDVTVIRTTTLREQGVYINPELSIRIQGYKNNIGVGKKGRTGKLVEIIGIPHCEKIDKMEAESDDFYTSSFEEVREICKHSKISRGFPN